MRVLLKHIISAFVLNALLTCGVVSNALASGCPGKSSKVDAIQCSDFCGSGQICCKEENKPAYCHRTAKAKVNIDL